MPKAKRLRAFAGPNGSGKLTLFQEISNQFNTGYFVNSDEIEQEISNITSFHYYLLLSKFSLRKCDSQ